MAYYKPGSPNSFSQGHKPNNQNRQNYGQQEDATESFFRNANFQSKWITDQADNDMVVFAEKLGKYMKDNGLTTSKIRNVYGEIKRIQMRRFEKEKASFYLLKPKMAYALGRDPRNGGLKTFKLLFDESAKSVSDDKSYQNFCNLMEAVLAYHKAFGGKD